MTALPEQIGAASWELEGAASNWANATDTFGARVPLMGPPIVPTDVQDRIMSPITRQYMSESKGGIRGPWKQSTFTVRIPLTGHGTATTGALTETEVYKILKNYFGSGSSDSVGGVVAAAPTSASQFEVTGGTLESNNLIRVGAAGDGRGGGQFAAVNNISTSTLLTALAATPNAADVVYSALNIYPLESSYSVGSSRWLLQTLNGQVKARGCFPTGQWSISGNEIGGNPFIDLTYGVSRWEFDVNETFPTATAAEDLDHVLITRGSCFLQDIGTVTRQTFALRSWSISGSQTIVPVMGQEGADAYQVVTGAVRTGDVMSLSLTVDAEASGTNTLKDIYESDTNQHCLLTLSTVAGRALAFYANNCVVTAMPLQTASDSLNRQTINLLATTGTDSSSDETRAPWRIAMA